MRQPRTTLLALLAVLLQCGLVWTLGSGLADPALPAAVAPGFGAASGQPSTVLNVADLLKQELSAGTKQMNTAQTAYDVYCKCPALIAKSKQLCKTVSSQCRKSFCMPICTRMAWTPRIEVHCERAPGWAWCPTFARQVQEAETAITAQFQAHTCLQLKLCNRTEEFIDWVENHTFGQHYPNHRLPIKACTLAEKPASQDERQRAQDAERMERLGSLAAAMAGAGDGVVSEASAKRKEEAAVAEGRQNQLCMACKEVVDVNILRGSCVAAGSQHADVLQEGSLQDRCLFLADVIGSRATQLLSEFKENVCSCLGCCGTGACYFPNIEKQWLGSLIESVQKKVKSELKREGWHLEL